MDDFIVTPEKVSEDLRRVDAGSKRHDTNEVPVNLTVEDDIRLGSMLGAVIRP